LSLPQKYLKVVAQLAASGALGAALLLGSAAPSAADQEPAARQPANAQAAGVAERLAAIRDAVSTVAGAQATEQLAQWWRNGGWGNGGWWRRRWWGNGGPWGNWRNGWRNWPNFWHNF
jgi:rSAM-associated Gly-rich repeat protein